MMNHQHAKRIQEIEDMLPDYTNHLNIVRDQYGQVKTYIRILEQNNILDVGELYNIKKQLEFSGYIAIRSLDLIVICRDMLRASQVWEEIYYLRQGYMCIYASVERFDAYRKWLSDSIIADHPDFAQELQELIITLRKFKKEFNYNTTIRTLRNEIIAHHDADFERYFAHVSGFDRGKAQQAISEFVTLLQQMRMVAKSLMVQAGKIQKQKESELHETAQRMVEALANRFAEMNI